MVSAYDFDVTRIVHRSHADGLAIRIMDMVTQSTSIVMDATVSDHLHCVVDCNGTQDRDYRDHPGASHG